VLLLWVAAPAGASEETRALWVVRYTLTSMGSVDRMIEIAGQMNMNTLLVQVRGRGDAYYPSELAPPRRSWNPCRATTTLSRT
jgi:uncharacterized lipoprotein YddW (UPF0748 family)